ncbi:type 1 glutamine amidotransferase [Arenibaculum sp.]|uniref:type 1 glutamine amidotransferase n=1 Tax=Arenibaculum sp. TaxID=2865862 RepID=UPI002E0D8F88|nr:type 1 glutamine amidotransferase [Arenibaculum sp.]
MAGLKLLIVDGNTRAVNDAHVSFGGGRTGEHYAAVLRALRPDADCTILRPAEAGGAELPAGTGLDAFDGVAWTGSALNVYQGGPAIEPQIALARAVFRSGTPMFGSCWGLQVATVAAGGEVRANPRGRELGIARRIRPTAAGAGHPMFAGKEWPFDAICVHLDEVAVAAPGTTVLAWNAISGVQAAEIVHDGGTCWGVQYHPEYDFNEIATVILRYGSRLVEAGVFADRATLDRFVVDLRALEADPGRRDLAWLYGFGPDVLEPALRRAEIANWLDRVVAPRAAARGRG